MIGTGRTPRPSRGRRCTAHGDLGGGARERPDRAARSTRARPPRGVRARAPRRAGVRRRRHGVDGPRPRRRVRRPRRHPALRRARRAHGRDRGGRAEQPHRDGGLPRRRHGDGRRPCARRRGRPAQAPGPDPAGVRRRRRGRPEVPGGAVTAAVLSLGSNLGDRFAHLRAAVAGLADVLVAASPVYETAPWGGVSQDDFLNAVLLVADPAVDAWGWLRRGQALEDAAGRVRDVRWGPRSLDVDVVTVADDGGDVRSADPELLLPHPGTPKRATVLRPWLDVDPHVVLPGHGAVAALLAAL